ncbi:hypothetical protein EDB86DRAFT_2955568, partial [Lactarius hatsudake]
TCTQAIPLSPSCDTWPHSGPPAPASVTTSPQPQYHHTRIRMRCPSTLTRHLDIAATPLDLTDPLRLPPRPPTTPPPPRHGRHRHPTPLRHFRQRRAPRPALAPSRHSPYRHLDAASYPFTLRRPHPIGCHFSTTCQLAASSSVILHVRSPVRQVHIPL